MLVQMVDCDISLASFYKIYKEGFVICIANYFNEYNLLYGVKNQVVIKSGIFFNL